MLAADVTAEWFTMQLHIWTSVLSYPHKFYCCDGSDAGRDRSTMCPFKKCIATLLFLLYWQNPLFLKYITM